MSTRAAGSRLRTITAAGATLLASVAGYRSTLAAEPATCLSQDPSQWPSPSKPYFMVIVDTSGSMGTNVGVSNSCGYATNRIGHARCAVKNTVQAFGGVNFGLAGYAWKETSCSNANCGACDQNTGCFPQCTATYTAADNNFCGPLGTESALNQTIHQGANIFVPLVQDHYWSQPPDATNLPSILNLVDDNCGNSEIGASSNTPLGGVLYNMNQYLSGTFKDPFGANYPNNVALASPLGTAAQGERGCRVVNIILITDGDETCDTTSPTPIAGGCRAGQANYLNTAIAGGFAYEQLASYEADRMYTSGVTFGGQNFKVKTHVIGFAGATKTALDHIAACGGTGTSYSTANETQLSAALANIVASAIKPETCDNADNNCNGCTDEGFTHYADVGQTCCAWANGAARTACLTTYKATITAQNPSGDVTKLPCTTVAQEADPASWLCYDPKETCDNVDNNGNGSVDEGTTKCGNPLHCPTAETCNGLDDNCDGNIDEGGVCGVNCVPSPEVCDGCDNDCDGIADNGVAAVPCGLASPANCVGTLTCKAAQPVALKGGCAVGGGFNACNNAPQAEVCDGIDNDCNGIADDNVLAAACTPANAPPGLVFGGTSQCKQGAKACGGSCIGYVGPSSEICDGIDNDCNGIVDDNVAGAGQACGTNQAPCSPGVTACVNGALTCAGGNQPQPELCDGIDNNCDGKVDNAPLADAPPPGQNGCWDLPGNCCAFGNLNWCPPAGATCNDNGVLAPPCNKGVIACAGAGGWVCQTPKEPGSETCDGIDNDCNGSVDDGPLPGVGQICGSDIGECKKGITACNAGVLDCAGATPPTPEVCDNKDNDCDGTIDNGIPAGAPCSVPYDMAAFPGDRSAAPCQPGVFQCDGAGNLVCVGGVGPTAEVCDGLDNDCDGTNDEGGQAPDGIDGSPSPNPPPAGNIGDVCGSKVGTCLQGTLACVKGQVVCGSGKQPSVEVCDCEDNDCDGTIDNQNPNAPPVCGAGKTCVKSAFGCQCAATCQGEFGCPGGQKCESVKDSQTDMALPSSYCVNDSCGDCNAKQVSDSNGNVICAPANVMLPNCQAAPVCQCKGQAGCKDPCYGVSCGAGTVCAQIGPNAGTCTKDSCFNNPCQGCGKVCNLGACTENPCKPDSCKPDEQCKPKADFSGFDCLKSCAGITCMGSEVCVAGQCVPTCFPACAAGEVCDQAQKPPVCVKDKCNPNPCLADGSVCDPATGACGNDPCSGVLCPTGQTCSQGECAEPAAGSGSSSAATSGASSSSTSGAAWALPTGGGGCTCEATGSRRRDRDGALVAVVAAATVVLRRRRRTRASSEEVQR